MEGSSYTIHRPSIDIVGYVDIHDHARLQVLYNIWLLSLGNSLSVPKKIATFGFIDCKTSSAQVLQENGFPVTTTDPGTMRSSLFSISHCRSCQLREKAVRQLLLSRLLNTIVPSIVPDKLYSFVTGYWIFSQANPRLFK